MRRLPALLSAALLAVAILPTVAVALEDPIPDDDRVVVEPLDLDLDAIVDFLWADPAPEVVIDPAEALRPEASAEPEEPLAVGVEHPPDDSTSCELARASQDRASWSPSAPDHGTGDSLGDQL